MKTQPETAGGTMAAADDSKLAGLLLVCGIVANWLVMLHRSLWIDEFLSVAVIHNSWRGFLHNATAWLYTSPLPYIPFWIADHVASPEGAPLRSASIIGVILAAFFVFRLLRRSFSTAAAVAGVIAFLTLPDVSAAAINVRPYAWALVPVAGAFLALSAWLQTGRCRFRVLYAVATALIPFGHPLFAAVVPAHAVFFAAEARRDPRVTRAQFAGTLLAGMAAWLLLARQLTATFGLRHTLSFANDVQVAFFVFELVRPLPIAAMLFVAGWISTRWLENWIRLGRAASAVPFALVWFVSVVCAPWSLPVFLAHAIVLVRWRGQARWPQLMTVGMEGLIGAAAAVAHRADLATTARAFADFGGPILDLRRHFVSDGLSALIALALMGAFLLERRRGRGDMKALAFGAAALFPFWILFAVTAFSGTGVFFDRYLSSAAVGIAGLAAWVAERLDGAVRWTLAAVLAIAGCVYIHLPIPYTNSEDWAAVAARCKEATPETRIALNSGLVEGNLAEWHDDPAREAALLLPLRYYGVERPIILLPFRADRPGIALWANRALDQIRSARQPLLVVDGLAAPNTIDWLTAALSPNFTVTARTQVGSVNVALFDPAPAADHHP